jgi:hypothetical protein
MRKLIVALPWIRLLVHIFSDVCDDDCGGVVRASQE